MSRPSIQKANNLEFLTLCLLGKFFMLLLSSADLKFNDLIYKYLRHLFLKKKCMDFHEICHQNQEKTHNTQNKY